MKEEKVMRTELKEKIISNSSGFGAGEGTTELYIYKCPCGEGEIREEHDNIPGFRDHDVFICCDECSKKWKIDCSKGARGWELIEIDKF